MICRPLKCIFIHIPKAAGRSVEEYFISHLGLNPDNDGDRRELLLTANDDPAKGPEKLDHLSALEYVQCGHVSQQEFEQYYKFSFVRNPWSRLVSEYRYRNYLRHKSFKDFVMNKMPTPGLDDKYRHVMPQSDMLCDKNNKLLVNFVGKFESLQQDFKQLCQHWGFEDTQIPHINSSNKKSRKLRRKTRNFLYRNNESDLRKYVDFYDDETREFVADFYKRDINNFDYEFADAV